MTSNGSQHWDESDLRRRFEAAGISQRLLYPFWYRAFRRLGIEFRPPVLLGFTGHLVFSSAVVLSTMIVIGPLLWLLNIASPREILLASAAAGCIAPITAWLRYRRLRSRVGA
jgi:hypothetical protein